MSAVSAPAKAILAGLLLTVLQLVVAVLLLAPDGALDERYDRLVQHDGYWFLNIVTRGYHTPVPPIDHKVMEVSNVAFFPAYPIIASALHYGLGLDAMHALLLAAQLAAWGFWSYFFLFCQRWQIPPTLCVLGALAIVAHPAAFFLVAAYSESLFLMGVFGFLYWSGAEGRYARGCAIFHGVMMSATRIVGIPCAAFPAIQSLWREGWSGLRQPIAWVRSHVPAVTMMLCSTLGAVLFFIYCLFKWGHWDMYMRTQFAGWGIEPDYLAIFRPSSYRWLIPALNDPTEASQMAMTLGALSFVVVGLCEVVAAQRGSTGWRYRLGFYFCAAAIYYISVSGVACVGMESMLRYQFCAHTLIVLVFLHFLRQFRPPPAFVRALAVATVVLGSAIGLAVQGWYVWNFTRGHWVA